VTVVPARSRKAGDIALSVVFLVLAWCAVVLGAVLALLSLAFLDYCPDATCSTVGASGAQLGAGMVAVLVGLVGTVVTIVLLVARRRGWWLALATWGVVVLVWVAGFALYAVAVDHPAGG
jgi:hypothetical protein